MTLTCATNIPHETSHKSPSKRKHFKINKSTLLYLFELKHKTYLFLNFTKFLNLFINYILQYNLKHHKIMLSFMYS